MNRTDAQRYAIASKDPRVLVVAGPGSGKTSTIVGRLERLIADGVDPRKIAAITFTNAAARELELRLAKTVPVDTIGPRLGYCGTLHGFALRCLRRHGGRAGYGERVAVINPEGAEALLSSKIRTIANGKITLKAALAAKALGRAAFPRSLPDLVVASYFDELREAGIVDFDVILSEFARCLEEEGADFYVGILDEFEHVFVDEVQDSAPIDWRIYKALPTPNKFLVGDPDQSIYGFRGAALGETVAAAESGAWKVFKLEENFRSWNAITKAAQRLIERNAGRVDKRTVSAKGVGGRFAVAECANAGTELATIAGLLKIDLGSGRKPEELAVLVRTNAIAAEVSKGLAGEGVPVATRVDPNLPPDLAFGRALASYLCNPENDTLGLLYTVAKLEKTGVEKKLAVELAHDVRSGALLARKSINAHAYGLPRSLPASEFPRVVFAAEGSRELGLFVAEKLRLLPDGAPMVELAHALGAGEDFEAARALSGDGVRVLTIHSAKGLEFDSVYLAAFEEETIPGRRKDVDVEEERRLAYVAITRAKRVAHITWARVRETKWRGLEPRNPSRFVEEAAR